MMDAMGTQVPFINTRNTENKINISTALFGSIVRNMGAASRDVETSAMNMVRLRPMRSAATPMNSDEMSSAKAATDRMLRKRFASIPTPKVGSVAYEVANVVTK